MKGHKISDDLSPTYPEKLHFSEVFERRLRLMEAIGSPLHKELMDKVNLRRKEARGTVLPTSHIQIILKNVLEDAKNFIIENKLVATDDSIEFAFEFNHNITYIHEMLHRTWRWTPGKKQKGLFENEEDIVEILAQYVTYLQFFRPEIHDEITENCKQLLRNLSKKQSI